jgi:cyclopropane fatty-acyl-phospholipid synthase-like methyltransferase
MSDNESVAHKDVYRRYFTSHLKKYQSLDPRDAKDYFDDLFEKHVPDKKEARILEIGAGLGKFVFYLKEKGFTDVTAIDISTEMAELARKHAGIQVQVITEPLEFLKEKPTNSYDAVYMLDVIEHVRKESVLDYLSLVHRVLKPEGSLHITTENMASPIGGRIQHYLDFTHEYNFSEASLRQVLEIAGFTNVAFRVPREKITGVRSFLLWASRRLLFGTYKIIYAIERPGMIKPTMFTKELVVEAVKSA